MKKIAIPPSTRRRAGPERGGGDRDRHEDQEREGVVEPARQVQQERQLRDVEEQHHRDLAFGQPLVLRIDEDGDEVRRDRRADGEEAEPEFEVEVEEPLRHRDRAKLPGDGDPAQDDQRPEPDPVRSPGFEQGESWIAHRPSLRSGLEWRPPLL
jgi:hypothetical protein